MDKPRAGFMFIEFIIIAAIIAFIAFKVFRLYFNRPEQKTGVVDFQSITQSTREKLQGLQEQHADQLKEVLP